MSNSFGAAALVFSAAIAALSPTPASAAERRIPGFDAGRGGIAIGNGKVVPLSSIWLTAGSTNGTPATAPAPDAFVAASNIQITHIAGPFPANEPAIAIDPVNSNHLIGSANDYRLGDSTFALYSSRNGGASWLDKTGQYLNSGPYYYQSSGDPALGIDRSSIDYFATLSFNRTDNSSAIVVARSTPAEADLFVSAIPVRLNPQGPTSTFFNDKDALTVDNALGSPTTGSVYSTWTLFNSASGGGSPIVESHSRDHGVTFSNTVMVSNAGGAALCSDSGQCHDDQGSSPATGPDGALYVAYENYDTTTTQTQFLISKSTDGGASFGAPIKVASVYNSLNPYKSFRVSSFPNLAVNATTGQLYLAWADERDGTSEIYITTSSDKAKTWSSPLLVAPTYKAGFRIFPAVGVQASTGNVYVSYYDNQRHPGVDLYDYAYSKLTAALKPLLAETVVSKTAINPHVAFGGGFIGDYTEMATSSLGANLIWTGTQSREQDIETIRVP